MGQLPDFGPLLLWLAAVCVGLGVALAFAIPWLWGVLKPLLHALIA
ncbi:MAG: hypothetical protein Q8K45_01895 [Rubrivivax sp.]|nr:hypothetical protein [Rubrivivax sp.]